MQFYSKIDSLNVIIQHFTVFQMSPGVTRVRRRHLGPILGRVSVSSAQWTPSLPPPASAGVSTTARTRSSSAGSSTAWPGTRNSSHYFYLLTLQFNKQTAESRYSDYVERICEGSLPTRHLDKCLHVKSVDMSFSRAEVYVTSMETV